MDVLRSRLAAIAVLLLATLAFTGVGVGSHDHDPLAASHGHRDLPTFSAGHGKPDRTAHIEGARRIESLPCIACLERQRHRGVEAPAATLGPFDLGAPATVLVSYPAVAAGVERLPASRAPPAA